MCVSDNRAACAAVCAAQVLYLARHVRTPEVPKSKKVEWWAASNYVWGFLDTNSERFPKKPDFTPLAGSKGTAMYQSVPVFGTGSRVRYRRRQCACSTCLPRDGSMSTMAEAVCPVFKDSKFKHMVGRTRIANMHRKAHTGTSVHLRSSSASATAGPGAATLPDEDATSLERFAQTFIENEVVAVNVADDDKDMFGEGGFWLAVVTELPKQLEHDMRHRGTVLEKGSWVVRCLWLHLVGTSLCEVEGTDDGVDEERRYQVAGNDEVMLDLRMVLQLPPAADEGGDLYEIGTLPSRAVGAQFTLSPKQTAYISTCLSEILTAHRDTDLGGLSLSSGGADEESETETEAPE